MLVWLVMEQASHFEHLLRFGNEHTFGLVATRIEKKNSNQIHWTCDFDRFEIWKDWFLLNLLITTCYTHYSNEFKYL